MSNAQADLDPTLELWRLEHCADLLRLVVADRQDIERREPWRPSGFFTLAGQQQRAAQILARELAGECQYHVIRSRGALVRTVGLELGSAGLKGGEGELGYWIAQPFRRRGLATGAARLVLAEAPVRGIRRVRANVQPDNLASRAVLRHLGFREVAEQLSMDDGSGVARAYLRFWLDVDAAVR